MADKYQVDVLTMEGLDATSTGDTLFDTTGGQYFYPLTLSISVTDIAGLVTPAVISMGTNSPNYNNIVAATTLTGLNAVNKILTVNVASLITSVPPETEIYVRVSVASVATTFAFRASMTGFILPS
jgi:hypothetical protein